MKKYLFIMLTISLVLLFTTAFAEVRNDVIETTFTVDLTGIILALLGILFSIAARYLIPLLKTEKNKRLARIAVYAAEQLFNSGEIKDKLEWAENWLLSQGVKLNTRELIEAIVGEMNEYKSQIDYDMCSNYQLDQLIEEGIPVDEDTDGNEE